ncbi:MAG TPA: flagellar hook-length control protein FliK [Caulobacteraceae bacterium]|jgi:hypothetical protein|nr:flagellar hook-length control protein FliK [Caulobacteraceae bacterium]
MSAAAIATTGPAASPRTAAPPSGVQAGGGSDVFAILLGLAGADPTPATAPGQAVSSHPLDKTPVSGDPGDKVPGDRTSDTTTDASADPSSTDKDKKEKAAADAGAVPDVGPAPGVPVSVILGTPPQNALAAQVQDFIAADASPNGAATSSSAQAATAAPAFAAPAAVSAAASAEAAAALVQTAVAAPSDEASGPATQSPVSAPPPPPPSTRPEPVPALSIAEQAPQAQVAASTPPTGDAAPAPVQIPQMAGPADPPAAASKVAAAPAPPPPVSPASSAPPATDFAAQSAVSLPTDAAPSPAPPASSGLGAASLSGGAEGPLAGAQTVALAVNDRPSISRPRSGTSTKVPAAGPDASDRQAPTGAVMSSAAGADHPVIQAVANPPGGGAPDFNPDQAQSQAEGAPAAETAPVAPGLDPSAPATGQGAGVPAATTTVSTATVSSQATAGTTSHLAAQMVSRISGGSSRFDVELDPAGLGGVRVAVAIDARGRLSAALSFDRPESAAALKAQSGVLQAALERAGFDLSGGGLSFDAPGSGGRQAQDGGQESSARAGRAFNTAAEVAVQTDRAAATQSSRAQRGLDIRI